MVENYERNEEAEHHGRVAAKRMLEKKVSINDIAIVINQHEVIL